MMRILRNERGMALALAIVALVVAGALIAGAFFAGTQEQRVGENSRRSYQSFGIAEAGANEIIRNWDPIKYNQRRVYPGDSVAYGPLLSPGGTGTFGGYVYKLNDETYLIDVTGQDAASLRGGAALARQGGGARQRVGILAKIRPLQIDVKASLTTRNSDKVSGGSTIDGFDHIPDDWTSCAPVADTAAKAGIRADQGATVNTSGGGTVTGMPPVMIDPSVSDSTFSEFGDVTYTDLAARANWTLPGQNFSSTIAPVVTNGQCDKTIATNWGDPLDPTAPCGGYFPIIHITGDANINGQQGQGILLVDGTLSVQGGFQWFGIAIIQGSLKTSGGGGQPAHFWGATLAHDSVSLGQENTISGAANILYSKCAVIKALEMTGLVSPLRTRSWIQLF